MLLYQEKQVFDDIAKLSETSIMISDALKSQANAIDALSKAVITLTVRISQLENQVQNLKSTIPF